MPAESNVVSQPAAQKSMVASKPAESKASEQEQTTKPLRLRGGLGPCCAMIDACLCCCALEECCCCGIAECC
ncbi:uncharacterized protein EHS24_001101 [Apiotrichum porosum]|uniref:Uncharacterized protein n=1 Tax=Apiotrichum porosum TaxID=105984 RepID=A0A427YBW8_9TREE|nr:uncharacterized protein EHS24_001101 [Apiotrichum porosum]RSH88556.1 hypothetical protein EHS24_001101 [Apiotrichum porosum]